GSVVGGRRPRRRAGGPQRQDARRGARVGRRWAAAGPSGRARRDRLGRHLPLLRPGGVRHGRRLERGWWNCADHRVTLRTMSDLTAGVTVGGYRIESLIGRGSSRSVYLAHGQSPDRPPAPKTLLPELRGRRAFPRSLPARVAPRRGARASCGQDAITGIAAAYGAPQLFSSRVTCRKVLDFFGALADPTSFCLR